MIRGSSALFEQNERAPPRAERGRLPVSIGPRENIRTERLGVQTVVSQAERYTHTRYTS